MTAADDRPGGAHGSGDALVPSALKQIALGRTESWCSEATRPVRRVMTHDLSTFERTLGAPDLRHVAVVRHELIAKFPCLGATASEAAVVVSELLTNAIRHGRAPVTIWAGSVDGALSVWVSDAAPFRNGGDEHSRGLQLIAALARSWGVCPLPDGGKAVWADVFSYD